ncbi:MAG: YggT family protein [Rhodobacteraceae bacterium]|nr:MAG: YggT family protein [Paracoccaceae bacterium]
MTSLFQIIFLLLDVLWYLIVIQVIMSWLVNFGILNMSQPFIIQIWSSINRLLEPIYRPVRNFLPATGGLDIAPLVVIVGIIIIRIILMNNVSSFV